jgi:hypothetical protein
VMPLQAEFFDKFHGRSLVSVSGYRADHMQQASACVALVAQVDAVRASGVLRIVELHIVILPEAH